MESRFEESTHLYRRRSGIPAFRVLRNVLDLLLIAEVVAQLRAAHIPAAGFLVDLLASHCL